MALILLLLLTSTAAAKPTPPSYPQSYSVLYNFTLPYLKEVQPDGLTFDVLYLRDADGQRSRIETYGGDNVEIVSNGIVTQVHPRINVSVCEQYKQDGSSNKHMGHDVFPRISSKEWELEGSDQIRGHNVHVWLYDTWHGDKHVIQRFYVSAADGVTPLRWHMHSMDLIDGAHYDEWLVDYLHYEAHVPPAHLFEAPKACDGITPSTSQQPRLGFTLRMQYSLPAFLPTPSTDLHEEYNAFAVMHNRVHHSPVEYQVRVAVYARNKAYIEIWNQGVRDAHAAAVVNGQRPPVNFTMAVNKFADWTEEEFRALILPPRSALYTTTHPNYTSTRPPNQYQLPPPTTPLNTPVPASVSWRGTLAEGPVAVKDQGMCGSCWAFAAVGALTGQYYLATGNSVDFSQQQLVDCSWNYGNNACDGGVQEWAWEYLVEHGGAMLSSDYEYASQDRYCAVLSPQEVDGGKQAVQGEEHVQWDTRVQGSMNVSAPRVAVKGYVSIAEGDTQGIKRAVYTQGPLAISIDAGQPSFRFYASGVYYEPNCLWKEYDLDHAVTLVGYGEEDGEAYWEVRNSWSKYWGDAGYIKMSQRGHACGVATNAAYTVVGAAEDVVEGTGAEE